MKNSVCRTLFITALTAFALTVVSSLTPELIAKDMVPYRGAGWGTPLQLTIIWPGTDPEYPNGYGYAVWVEYGQATHFGQYEATAVVEGWFEKEEDIWVLVWTGTYVQVAADGSSITAQITEGREPLVPPPTPMFMTITITSGTGRFEGATGSWEMSALSTGDMTYTTEGLISSIGSARSRK